MAKDATPDRVKIVNDNFANENHQRIARLLEERWSASSNFSDLGDDEEFDAHRATIQNVYNRYCGVPESVYNDGIEDKRTIQQIKDDHGSFKEYRELRDRGDLDPEEWNRVEWLEGFEPETEEDDRKMISYEEHMEKVQETYRKAYRDGQKDKAEELLDQ